MSALSASSSGGPDDAPLSFATILRSGGDPADVADALTCRAVGRPPIRS